MISTKGRYAIRLMIDLAAQPADSPTTLDAIATRQEISKKYLESIVKLLVNAKLVRGTSGKGGGYFLTRRPEEYTVLEILNVTEGSLAVVACLKPNADICPREGSCSTVSMWRGFDELVTNYFSHITIKDLIDGK